MLSHQDLSCLPSLFMPGALHHPGSSFMRIYYQYESGWSILLEVCTLNGFEYYEYYSIDERHGLILSLYMPIEDYIPRRNQTGNITFRLDELENENNQYRLIFAGEVDSEKIITNLEGRKIEMDLCSRTCSMSSVLPATWLMNELGIQLVYPKQRKNFPETNFTAYSCVFNSGLLQVKNGKLQHEKSINLTGNQGAGLAGNGCTLGLIKCFESPEAQCLDGINIVLSGNRINEKYLLDAIVSGLIPLEIDFIGLSKEFYFDWSRYKYCCYVYTMFLWTMRSLEVSSGCKDIFSIVLNYCIGILKNEFALVESQENISYSYKTIGLFHAKQNAGALSGLNKIELQALAGTLSHYTAKELGSMFFKFSDNGDQVFYLISSNLKRYITNEINEKLTNLFFRMDAVQQQILLKIMNGKIEDYSSLDLVEERKVKVVDMRVNNRLFCDYTILTGDGFEFNGLIGIYHKCLSADLLNLAFKRHKWERVSATHDTLKSSPEKRAMKMSLHLFMELLKVANLAELSLMIENSKNRDSSSMRLLSEDYQQIYCKALTRKYEEMCQQLEEKARQTMIVAVATI